VARNTGEHSGQGVAPSRAHEAIEAAFDEIALVHRKMSFHDPESDVGQLNRFGYRRPVEVHHYIREVLQWALQVAEHSNGCFDIAVGRELVEWEFLPRPAEAFVDPAGSWQDIELRAGGEVEFHRPLWIDLGGIEKGYAVDRAVQRLEEWDVPNGVVNAGERCARGGRADGAHRPGAFVPGKSCACG
jgi:FAD:protein FMN transferase